MDADGDIVFAIDDDGSWDPADVIGDDQSKNFDDNEWHHFAALKDGTTGIYLYVDGVLIDQDTSLAETGNISNVIEMYVGSEAEAAGDNWLGYLDEIKIYRSLRTASEINADFLRETPSRGTAASFGGDQSYLSNGLVGYWKMDESSGDATDSSGNNFTLTNNGTTTFVPGKFLSGSEHAPASTQYFSAATSIN